MTRKITAVHGLKEVAADPEFERGLAHHFRTSFDTKSILSLYGRFASGEGDFDALMRRVLWHALTRQCGNGLHIGSGVGFKHPETFEIGHGVFIGSQAYIQGRFDGKCVIGDHAWLGPQSYFDARDLTIGEYVGWGPGAKVLGSIHSGNPLSAPVIQTDLEIKPVRIEPWADVGTNAVVLPGVTIGKGAIVGAGAVVNRDVPAFAVVAGVPARFLHWREGYDPKKDNEDKK